MLVGFNSRSVPTPLRGIVCGLPPALSVTTMEPVWLPIVIGLNVTFILQLAPGLTEEPQVFVWLNWPVAAMLVIVRSPRPVLVKVTTCGLLVVNTTCVPKVRLDGDKLAVGVTPTPTSEII